MAGVDHAIRYIPGTRRAGSATFGLVSKTGLREELTLELLLCFRMKGIGVLEQIAFGPHARYGFKEFLDPAD